jgi:thiamine pyrophosphate-dependent acetolactate synthase large subunit-like protein
VAKEAEAKPQRGGRGRGGALVPSEAQLATDTGGTAPPAPSVIVEHPASDFMVDVIKALGIEYVAANPGSSFDSIQESIINYGGNSKPEFLTCCHEESSVAMAHGYAKIEGKPMLAMLHGTVGIQHAAMAIYNAYGDRVPVYMIAGNGKNAVLAHAAQDLAAMVRDCLKWDDEPSSPAEFASSAMRAYRIAMTPPMAPVLLVVDNEMQLSPLNQPPRVPKFTMPAPPSADIDTVKDIAKQLVAAENLRISAGRAARTPNGLKLLVQLAELLQAPVGVGGERVNFPSRHPLSGNGTGQADLILALEGSEEEPRVGSGQSASAPRTFLPRETSRKQILPSAIWL